MFNLLMFNTDWTTGRATVPIGRMFEWTSDEIKAELTVNNQPNLEKLVALPCLFCEEGTTDEIAYIGQINRARIVGREVVLEFSFDPEVPTLSNQLVYEKRNELEMPHDFEFSRNHWAVKEIDLYRFLLRSTRPRRQRPIVFQIPEHESIDRALASAMMPFNGGFDAVYECISESTEQVGLRCRRADNIWENPAIIQDVVSLIDRSKVVICDCTGRNPNVFYEIGIAHTLGREVILITQNPDDIPFDLRHLRYVRYLNNAEGRAELRAALTGRIATILGH